MVAERTKAAIHVWRCGTNFGSRVVLFAISKEKYQKYSAVMKEIIFGGMNMRRKKTERVQGGDVLCEERNR